MITSEQISALIAVQQQQARAMQSPQMLGMPMPVPGPSQYPPQFDFGLRGQGAMSTAGAHVAMAGIGAIPPAISGMGLAAGNIQGIGALGGMAGFGAGARLAANPFLSGLSMLDPMSSAALGAFGGGSAAWGMGAGAVARGAVGGAFFGTGGLLSGGLLNPITLGAMGASFGIGQMHQGFSDQQGLNGQLGGMQFMNSGAHFGRGFSSSNMMQFGNAVRSIDAADPFTTMRDMTGMLGKFNEMGMGQTSRDADEFTRKFKAMAETVRTLAKTMGTTIDEASQTFSGLRQAGIYSARDVIGAGTQIKTLGTMGMSSDQAMGLMQTGAGISRSMDMRGRAGSRAASGLAESLLTASQLGSFSGEEMMDATGAPDVTTAASQMSLSMTSKLASFLAGSAVGQATLATVGEKEHGKYTGHVDMGQLEGILSGKTGVKDLSSMGRGRLAGKDAGLSFTVKNRDIAAGLLEQDPMAVTGILMNSIRDRHPEMDEEGLFKYTMEHMVGLDRRETEVAAKMFKDYEATRRERNRKRMQEVQQAMSDLDVKQYHTIEGWKTLVSGTVTDALTPLREAGAQLGTNLERGSQITGDYLMGRTHRYSGTGMQNESLRRAMLGGGVGGISSLDERNSGGTGLVKYGVAGRTAIGGDFSDIESAFSDPAERALIEQAALRVKGNSALRQGVIDDGAQGVDIHLFGDALAPKKNWASSGLSKEESSLFYGARGVQARALVAHKAGLSGLGQRIASQSAGFGASQQDVVEDAQGKLRSELWGMSDFKGGGGGSLLLNMLGAEYKISSMQEDLMSSGGMDVLSAVSRKGWTLEDLEREEVRLKGEQGMSDDDAAMALGKMLGVEGLTGGGLRSARGIMRKNAAASKGDKKYEKEHLSAMVAAGSQMQMSGDFSGMLTQIGRGDKGLRSAGSKELSALSTTLTEASQGRGGDVYGAMDKYLDALAGSEDLSKVAGSGDFGAAVAHAVSLKGRISKIRGDAKQLDEFGFSDQDLKDLGISTGDGIDEKEARTLAGAASRREAFGVGTSGSSVVTSTTESTERELQLAQQMTLLAETNKKFVETVGVLVASQKGTSTSLGNKPTTPVIGVPTPERH